MIILISGFVCEIFIRDGMLSGINRCIVFKAFYRKRGPGRAEHRRRSIEVHECPTAAGLSRFLMMFIFCWKGLSGAASVVVSGGKKT